MKAKPVEARIESLGGFAHGCSKALREVLSVMTDADRSRIGALYGGIGFFLGASGAVVACSSLPVAQPGLAAAAIAVACALIGVRVSYSSADLARKRMQAFIAEAREMRDDEVSSLDDRVKRSRADKSSDLPLLEFKRTALLLASNDQLLIWAGLCERGSFRHEVAPLQLAPPSEKLIALLPSPSPFPQPISPL